MYCGNERWYDFDSQAHMGCNCTEHSLESTNELSINVLHHQIYPHIMTQTNEEFQEYSQLVRYMRHVSSRDSTQILLRIITIYVKVFS